MRGNIYRYQYKNELLRRRMAAQLLLLTALNCSDCGAHFTRPSACPANFITRRPGASSVDDCVCPGGYFVANVTCSECPGGFVCPADGTTLPVPCAPGTFCPPRSLGSIQCPAGSVCGMTASAPTPCDALFYCPEGTKQQQPCPPGALCGGLGGAVCAFGGAVPNCTQCANCSCGEGLVAYNATCHNLTNGCPTNLDCARRNALGVAPCVDGFGLVEGVCVAEPSWATPPVIAGIAAGAAAVVAMAAVVALQAIPLAAGGQAASMAAGGQAVAGPTKSEASFKLVMPRIKLH